MAAILASFETIALVVLGRRTVRTTELKKSVHSQCKGVLFASAQLCISFEAGVVSGVVCVPDLGCKDSEGGVQLCFERAIVGDCMSIELIRTVNWR